MWLCVVVCTWWERLPRTTGTAASPQRRWSRYGSPAVYQTADPNWDGPEKDATNTRNPEIIFDVQYQVWVQSSHPLQPAAE